MISSRILPNDLQSLVKQLTLGHITLHRLSVSYVDVFGDTHRVSITDLCDADLLLLVWWACDQTPSLLRYRPQGNRWLAAPKKADAVSCLCSLATVVLQSREVIHDVLLRELVMGERPTSQLKVDGVTIRQLFRTLAGLRVLEATLVDKQLNLERSDVQLLLQHPVELIALLQRLRLRRRKQARSNHTNSRKVDV